MACCDNSPLHNSVIERTLGMLQLIFSSVVFSLENQTVQFSQRRPTYRQMELIVINPLLFL